MAYDEELAERIREIVYPGPDLVEQPMFGGLAFLVGGNMAVAASGKGGLLVRVDTAAVADDAVLREWVERGVNYARTLPRKK